MDELAFLFGGAFLIGLSGAMMPGPVLTATIGETMRRGFRAGPLIVFGHALVEAALLAALVAGFAAWLRHPVVLGVLGVLGGAVLIGMGAQTLRTADAAARAAQAAAPDTPGRRRRGPIATGMVLSVTNPYWMVWWATIGLHYAAQSLQLGGAGLASFYAGHILSDLAWYSLVAAAVAAGRRICPPAVHRAVLGICGAALIGLGAYFLGDGLGAL